MIELFLWLLLVYLAFAVGQFLLSRSAPAGMGLRHSSRCLLKKVSTFLVSFPGSRSAPVPGRKVALRPALDRILYSLAMGFAALSILTTFLGVCQLLYSWLFRVILLMLLFVFTWLSRKEIAGYFRRTWRLPWQDLSGFSRFAIIVVILVCVKNLMGALTPEVRHDVVNYHLNFPNLYLLNHGIIEIRWHSFSYMPAYVEMLYTMALAISSDILAKLIHFGFSIICALFLFRTGKRYFNRRVGELGMLFWLLTPKVAYETSTAYIDLGVSLWSFASIGMMFLFFESSALVIPAERENRYDGNGLKPLVLSGFFAGMALGSKYTAGPFFVLPSAIMFSITMFFCANGKKFGLGNAFKKLFLWGAIVALTASPWLIMNFIWTGNPVYPMGNSTLGLTQPHHLRAQAFFRGHGVDISTWSLYWQNWSRKINALAMDGTLLVNMLFVLILLAPVGLLLKRTKDEGSGTNKRVLLLSGVHFTSAYLFWVHLSNNLDGRFLMPSYLTLCILLGVGYGFIAQKMASLSGKPALAGRILMVLTLIMAMSFIIGMRNFYADLGESPWPILGENNRRQYRLLRKPHYALNEYVDQELPDNVRIMGIGFPSKRPYISHPSRGYHPFEDRFGAHYSAIQMTEALHKEKVDYIVVPNQFGISSSRILEMKKAGFEEIVKLGGRTLFMVPEWQDGQ